MRCSVRKLAQKAGVSAMTVSRALRSADGVSDELRKKIIKLAREAGYPIPKTIARPALHLWGVICAFGVSGDDGGESFHRRILQGMRAGAGECNSEVLNYTGPDTLWPLVVVRRQVDGVIIVRGNENSPHPPFPVPVPGIFIFNGPEGADLASVDNFGGSRELGTELARLGHRRVAYLGPETAISRERLAGFRTGIEAAGGEVPQELIFLLRDAGSRESSRRLADDLVRSCGSARSLAESVTALMVYNDYMAAAVIERLGEAGLDIPRHLSVAGFDDAAPSWYHGPKLTTISLPLEEIGAEASRMVYWRISHPEASGRRLVLSARLVRGATTRPL